MNLIQAANDAKNFSDQQLQRELTNPTGMVPTYIALSELQRRKDMRNDYTSRAKAPPQQSMAEEFAKGMGSANTPYAQAVGQGMGVPQQGVSQPPRGMTTTGEIGGGPMNQPMGQSPMGRPMGFANGGVVPAPGTPMAAGSQQQDEEEQRRRNNFTWLGYLGGGAGPERAWAGPLMPTIDAIAQGRSFGDIMTTLSPVATVGKAFGMADGGPVSIGPLKVGPIAENTGNPWDWMFLQGARTLRDLPGNMYRASPLPLAVQGAQGAHSDLRRYMQGRFGMIPQNATSPGDEGVMYQPTRGGEGFAGPDPMSAGIPAATSVQGMDGPDLDARMPATDGQGGPQPPPQVKLRGGAGGGASGGLGSVARGTLGDFVNEVRGLQAPDRYAELAAANRNDRDALTEQRESEKGMALLQAGLGIMGGQSPFPSVNIGQGGTLGVRYWQDAQKELRQAGRDIRRADEAIAIAQANRDERQLEMSIKQKMEAEANYQRHLDRISAQGIAAANRAETRDLREKELASLEKDRTERRYQTKVHEYGVQATGYEKLGETARLKLLALTSDITKTPPKEEVEAAEKEVAYFRSKAARAYEDRRLEMNRYSAYTNSYPMPKTRAEVDALPAGAIYLDTDGELVRKKK